MEINVLDKIIHWSAIRLLESKALAEKLAREGPVIFQDESITLHRASYEI